MDSNGEPQTVCLGVAIDHRIRKLFKPVPCTRNAEVGNHVTLIQAHGHQLKKNHDEINVTGDLAAPTSTGGIAIALQQPRDHPFHEGTESVIENCKTLVACRDIFNTCSCGTLDLVKDVSVIDLLPYIMVDDKALMDDKSIKSALCVSVEIFCSKKPDILLCAGRIPIPADYEGEARKLMRNSIGKTFGKDSATNIRHKNGEIVSIRRVNGFHPSYAMNHKPEYSCFRQLLMLVAAETCAVYRGDWKEEGWMGSLRDQCSKLSSELYDRDKECSTTKHLPYYADQLSELLRKVSHAILEIAKFTPDTTSAPSGPAQVYTNLVKIGLSELCNNASLVLYKMSELKRWPSGFYRQNQEALSQAATETLDFVTPLILLKWPENQLLRTILGGIGAVRHCVSDRQLNLENASKAWRDIAVALEVTLWNMREDIIASDRALDDVTDMFAGTGI